MQGRVSDQFYRELTIYCRNYMLKPCGQWTCSAKAAYLKNQTPTRKKPTKQKAKSAFIKNWIKEQVIQSVILQG